MYINSILMLKKALIRPLTATKDKSFDFINNLLTRRYRFLLYTLVGMIILPSFLIGYPTIQDALSFGFRSAVMYAGVYAIQKSDREFKIGLIIGFAIILINSFGVFQASARLNFYFSFIFYILFYVFVAYRLLTKLLKTEKVTVGVLYAAVNVYLLMGIIGGYLFMLIENASPGSLNNLAIENLSNPSKFFYFSFITLSTLGYGDITPAMPASQSLAMVLSTTGPLYLTIMVALLVSRFDNSASEIH